MKIQSIGASRSLVCFLAVPTCPMVTIASSAASAGEQVKALMQRYNQEEGSDPEMTVRQAWYNRAGDLLKVTTERVIGLQVVSIEPEVPRRGELYYSLDKRLRLQTTGTALSARVIDVRHAKEER